MFHNSTMPPEIINKIRSMLIGLVFIFFSRLNGFYRNYITTTYTNLKVGQILIDSLLYSLSYNEYIFMVLFAKYKRTASKIDRP